MSPEERRSPERLRHGLILAAGLATAALAAMTLAGVALVYGPDPAPGPIERFPDPQLQIAAPARGHAPANVTRAMAAIVARGADAFAPLP